MKIFITGGAGFVGSALVKNLSDLDFEVTVYDNFIEKNFGLLLGQQLKNVKFIKGDILDSRSLKKSMAGHDAVVHLAESKNLDHPHGLEQVNHWGTAEVCYAIETLGIKNFINLSSTKVYPYTSGEDVIEENFDANPYDAYGSSKLRAEDHVKRFFDKTDHNIHILRVASVYGMSPSQKISSFLNRLVMDAHYFNRIQLFGTGFQHRSFVHIDNVVSVITRLLIDKVPSQIHNLSDLSLSLIDLIDNLKELYPDMEFIFTSHHLSVPNIRVKTSKSILPFCSNGQTMVDNLKEIKSHFSI